MKKLALFGMLLFLMTSTVPSYGFLDYFFSGSGSRDAIDNSAVGDLRAWWTGNPGYQFNPYWSGPQPNQQQGQQTNPLNPASTQGYSPMGSPSAGTPQAHRRPSTITRNRRPDSRLKACTGERLSSISRPLNSTRRVPSNISKCLNSTRRPPSSINRYLNSISLPLSNIRRRQLIKAHLRPIRA